ncbi:MAG TPA: DUF6644 family protein [Allosphingosinicella sp.]
MFLQTFCEWVEQTSVAVTIAESAWMFPTLESIHVLALGLVVGSIAMVDLRLLGLSTRSIRVSRLSEDVLPWTWASFAVAVTTGLLLFASNATSYYDNIPFRLKLVLIALAGANMLLFHFGAYRRVAEWDQSLPAPLPAKMAGALSLTFWIGVVTAGRWIGFV